jgi:hypothetical protein
VTNENEPRGGPTPPDQLPRTGSDQFGETRKGLDAVSYNEPVSAGPLGEMPVPPITAPQASKAPDRTPHPQQTPARTSRAGWSPAAGFLSSCLLWSLPRGSGSSS